MYLAIFIGVQILLSPLVWNLVNKTDKRKVYYFGLPLALLAFIGVGLYPADWPLWGTYTLTGLTALGFAGAQLTSWIIFPDAVDAGELKLGDRPTGSFSGIMTFIRKISAAIAIQFFGIMLTITHYVTPTEAEPIPVQPPETLTGIRIAMAGGFVLLMAWGWIAARKFVLTKKRSEQVRKFLQIKAESGLENLDPEAKQELEELKKTVC